MKLCQNVRVGCHTQLYLTVSILYSQGIKIAALSAQILMVRPVAKIENRYLNTVCSFLCCSPQFLTAATTLQQPWRSDGEVLMFNRSVWRTENGEILRGQQQTMKKNSVGKTESKLVLTSECNSKPEIKILSLSSSNPAVFSPPPLRSKLNQSLGINWLVSSRKPPPFLHSLNLLCSTEVHLHAFLANCRFYLTQRLIAGTC